MTISRFQRTAHGATMIVVLVATLGITGCNRDSAAVAAAPTGAAPAPALLVAADAAAMPAAEKSAVGSGASVTVKVSLNPALAKKAAPDDVVYIFARAVEGPRMPLAIVRKQVKDLPATIVLDDSSGMMSDMKLSSVPEVIVVARVSKSGNPTAQAGDLEGMSAALKPNAQTLELSIANVLTGK